MGEFGETPTFDFQKTEVKLDSLTEPGKKLTSTLEQSEIDFKIKTTGLKEAPEIFILDQQNNTDEKCVRIYRGIGQIETVLEQVPYAMRESDGSIFSSSQKPEIAETVEKMATKPNYETFAKYIDLALKNGGDSKKLREKLFQIESDVLKGESGSNFSKVLKFETFKHTGGLVMESGISPYMSASSDITEAFGFTRKGGAIMVIDIPISNLSFYNDSSSELFINGSLDSKYIRAIIPKVEDIDNESEFFDKINEQVDDISGNIFSKSELPEVVSEHFQSKREVENEQDQISIKLIQNKRAKDLINQYGYRIPEIEDFITDNQENIDPYHKTMMVIFDALKKRLDNIGVVLDEFSFREGNSDPFKPSLEKKYIKSDVDEHMLTELNYLATQEQKNHDLIMERKEEKRREREKEKLAV